MKPFRLDKNLDFSGVKYVGGRDEDIHRLDQPTSNEELDLSDLAIFSPLAPEDVFEIAIRQGIDLGVVLKHLYFDSDEQCSDYSYLAYGFPTDWVDSIDDNRLPSGVVLRYALISQGDDIWRIVGFPDGDKVTLQLMNVDWQSEPAYRYRSKRVLADFAYHTDGPGPVSWDFSSAILDLDGTWLYAYGGDHGREDKLVQTPEDFASAYLDWLVQNQALPAFLLASISCQWSDEDAVEEFNALLDSMNELIEFRASLTKVEREQVLRAIQHSEPECQQLIEILAAKEHQLTKPLLTIMQEAVEFETATMLVGSGVLIARLRQLAAG